MSCPTTLLSKPAAQLLQIHPGAKCPPGTCHDGNPNLRIRTKFTKRLPERKAEFRRERVHRVGAIERQGGNRTLLFQQQY
jgi:hypothetical protein